MNLRAAPEMFRIPLRVKANEGTGPVALPYQGRSVERQRPYRDTPDFLLRDMSFLLLRQAS